MYIKTNTTYYGAHCKAYYAPLCSQFTLSRQKRKEGEILEFYVSLCLKLATTRCAPMGSWNYFKVDNMEADIKLSKVNSMRQETAQPQEPAQGQTLHLGGGNIWIHQSSATSQRTSGWPVHHQQKKHKTKAPVQVWASLWGFELAKAYFMENVLTLMFWKHILGHIACTMCSQLD